jgi:hypothetical protein
MRQIWLGIVLLACIGCKNPFAEFYHDQTGGHDLVAEGRIGKGTGSPQVYTGTTPEADSLRMYEDGYLLLGYSSFNGNASVEKDDAISHGVRVGATTILLYPPKHTGTRSGSMPLVLPNNTTTYSTGSATAYGPGGTATVFGSGTSTTFGTQVVDIPYSVERYDYMASYWAKGTRPIVFGARYQDLNPAERAELGTNKGVKIIGVLKGGPAYRADILLGDIIRKIGRTEIQDSVHFGQVLQENNGTTAAVDLIRGGAPKTILVELNALTTAPTK